MIDSKIVDDSFKIFTLWGGKNSVNFFENLVISLAVFFDGIGIDKIFKKIH